MNGERSMGVQAPSLESVQEVRLLALLHDLVRKDGRSGAAAVLGVHRKTVAAAVNTGRLSRRMWDALGLLLMKGRAAGAPTDEAEGQRRPWEQHLETALRRQREELLAAISAQGQQLRDEVAQRAQTMEGRLAALESRRGAGGVAAPLIAAWRRARDARTGAADHLTAVKAEERLRELELALIGAYQLTLPPATYPWDDLTRREELHWRRLTLVRVRGERRRAAWRHRLRRVLTLGWW